jgi:DMSO/TMAO reductase YedYZ molybdopterin-dependent catalytic subunit
VSRDAKATSTRSEPAPNSHATFSHTTLAPVTVLHGASLRLRCENEFGFKMAKWIAAIQFVHNFTDLGAGQGGYNEDHEFYGYPMLI